VCKEHAQSLPHILALYHDAEGLHKALVVGEAVYCGICKPREDPVDLPELE
jgi:hypothetical protein